MATIAITEATPIIMPSIVRKVLSLFRNRALKAILIRLIKFILILLNVVLYRQRSQFQFGIFYIFVHMILNNFTVFQGNGSATELCDIRLMRYKYDCFTVVFIQILKKCHDTKRRF